MNHHLVGYIVTVLVAFPLNLMVLILGWVGINSVVKVITNKNNNDPILYFLYRLVAIAFIVFIVWIAIHVIQGNTENNFIGIIYFYTVLLTWQPGNWIILILKLLPIKILSDVFIILVFLVQLSIGWLGINTLNKVVDAKHKGQPVPLIRWIISILFILYVLFTTIHLGNCFWSFGG